MKPIGQASGFDTVPDRSVHFTLGVVATMNRVPSKSVIHATAAVAALLALGGCAKPEAQTTTDTAAKAGATASAPAAAATPNMVSFTAKEFSFAGPDTIPAGLTMFHLTDAGQQLHHVQLIKLQDGKITLERYWDVHYEENPAWRERSLDDLRRTIAKLARTSRERFDATFAAANDKLAEVFPKLFPGGKASLELTEANEEGEAGVEIVVQPAEGRRKHLFLADMDSTMIGQECIDEMADFVGKKAEVSAVTERAMRGEIAFEPALRARVALLKGLPENIAEEVIANRITLTPGGRTAIATMRKHGAYTALVSGGFTIFTQRIAAMIGFDESRGNILNTANGLLTGEVADPIFGRDAKRAALIELRTQLKLQNTDTMATGDGANDLDMISEAGLGVAYHAKPAVAAAAGARIDNSNLTALLYMQGYRRTEFAP